MDVTVQRKPQMLLSRYLQQDVRSKGAAVVPLNAAAGAGRVRPHFVADGTNCRTGWLSVCQQHANRISISISHNSLYLGRNGMKRMLPGLLLFAVIVSLTCLANSTDAAALFKAKCAMCHGPDGTANTTMGKNLGMGIKSYKSPDVQKQ